MPNTLIFLTFTRFTFRQIETQKRDVKQAPLFDVIEFLEVLELLFRRVVRIEETKVNMQKQSSNNLSFIKK